MRAGWHLAEDVIVLGWAICGATLQSELSDVFASLIGLHGHAVVLVEGEWQGSLNLDAGTSVIRLVATLYEEHQRIRIEGWEEWTTPEEYALAAGIVTDGKSDLPWNDFRSSGVLLDCGESGNGAFAISLQAVLFDYCKGLIKGSQRDPDAPSYVHCP